VRVPKLKFGAVVVVDDEVAAGAAGINELSVAPFLSAVASGVAEKENANCPVEAGLEPSVEVVGVLSKDVISVGFEPSVLPVVTPEAVVVIEARELDVRLGVDAGTVSAEMVNGFAADSALAAASDCRCKDSQTRFSFSFASSASIIGALFALAGDLSGNRTAIGV
jgi:hypothetical protein